MKKISRWIILILFALIISCNNVLNNGIDSINNSSIKNIPIEGLIAEYLFNGDASDTSGKGNNGTINGATATTDRFGNTDSAFSFNGNNNWIQVPHSSSLNTSSEMSISAWIISDIDATSNNQIILKGNSTSDFEYSLFFTNLTNYPVFVIGPDQTNYSQWTTTQSTTEWIHVTAVYDGTTQKLYINGELKVSQPKTSTPITSGDLYIGYRLTDNQYLKGKLDNIRIYSRALSDEEIDSLFNEGDGVYNQVIYDTFINSTLNTNNFTYDTTKVSPSISGGFVVVPIVSGSSRSTFFTKKFKLPAIIEGRIKPSDSGTSYPNFGIYRYPDRDYVIDCISNDFIYASGWDYSYIKVSRYYYTNPSTSTRENVTTSYSETTAFDFKFIITAANQKIYYNGTLVNEFTESLTENYWWFFGVNNAYNTSTVDIDWIRIRTNEFGDVSGMNGYYD